MNLKEKLNPIKISYLTISLIYIVVYIVAITLVYFLDQTVTKFDFLIISIFMVVSMLIAHAYTFISAQKKYFQLQELLQNSTISDEELAEKSKIAIDKIKLLKMEFFTYSDQDFKILNKILRDK